MRSALQPISLVVLLALVLSACAAANPSTSEPAMFHNGPAHTGVYDSVAPRELGGVKWQFQTGGKVRGAPIVSGGVIYIGSHDGSFYALDETIGELKWKFDTGHPITATAAATGGSVFFTSMEGMLYSVSAKDGTEQWRYPFKEFFADEWDVYASSPTIVDGVIYFGDGNTRVHAVDLKTGQAKWVAELMKLKPESSITIAVHTSPTVVDGSVFIGNAFGDFFALNAETGEVIWKKPHGGTIAGSAAADGVVYYTGRDTYVRAVEAKTGSELWNWHSKAGSWMTSSPAIADGVVYTGSSDDRSAYAFDAETGKELWRTPLMGRAFSAPALTSDTLFIGSEEGQAYGGGSVFALDRKTGEVLWEFKTGGNVFSSPVVDGGVVFVGSDDGSVYALK